MIYITSGLLSIANFLGCKMSDAYIRFLIYRGLLRRDKVEEVDSYICFGIIEASSACFS